MKNSSQLYMKIIVLSAILLLGIIFYYHHKTLLYIWVIALAIGFVLHRSGICFSGAFTDMILFRNYTMIRALLIIIIVSLIGISTIQFYSLGHGQIPGNFSSIGIHSVVGAFLFGVGMVFAGACGCGTLQRIGEGFALYFFVLIGIMVGSVIGAYHFSWWVNSFIKINPVFLPNIFGWPWGALISFVILGSLYVLTLISERGTFIFQKGWGKWQKKG